MLGFIYIPKEIRNFEASSYWKDKYERVILELEGFNAANNLLLERINMDLNPRIKELTAKDARQHRIIDGLQSKLDRIHEEVIA